MNWYKIAQFEMVDQREGDLEDKSPGYGNYTDIAHEVYNREKVEIPNIMWILNNGSIDTIEETSQLTAHALLSRWIDIDTDKTYYGRYSPSQGIITVVPPGKGIRKFSAIPKAISSLLRMKFPDANKLYIF